MKTIDIKSLLIGILLASTVLLAIGATGPDDKWDRMQHWEITLAPFEYAPGTPMYESEKQPFFRDAWHAAADGAEPFAVQGKNILFRKRLK